MANDSVQQVVVMMSSARPYLSYLLTRDFDTLQQAVRSAEDDLGQTPPDTPHMPMIQFNLARALVRRFVHTKQAEDIAKAIDMFDSVRTSTLLPDDHPVRHMSSYYRDDSILLQCFPLEELVELKDLCVCIPAEGKVKTAILNLAEDKEVFQFYYRELSGSEGLEYVDSTIQFHRQALKYFSSPPSDPCIISEILYNLGHDLIRRYSLHSLREDIDEAVDCFCRALRLSMSNGPVFEHCLMAQSDALIKRFEALGEREDLENAANLAKEAVEKFDEQHIRFALCWDNLARVMIVRFRNFGNVSDLDAAIEASRRAVDIGVHNCIKGEFPTLLVNLALHLRIRFARTGHSQDLRKAIELTERALSLGSPEDPERVKILVHLSIFEQILGDKLPDEEYRIRALRHIDEAWSVRSLQQHRLNLVSNILLHNFTAIHLFRLGKKDEAIEMLKMLSTNSACESNPEMRFCRLILCQSLLNRWKDTPKLEDLDGAISTANLMIEVGELTPDESTYARTILGNCLYHRYKIVGDERDLEAALAVLEKGLQMSAAALYLRIDAGQKAINFLSEQAKWDRAHKLSQVVIDLVVLLNGRSLEWTDKQFWLQHFSHQAATYASIALQAESSVFDIINMLETCRGAILSHVIDSRTDLDDLKKAAPEKAQRFSTLRDEVNPVINVSTDVEEISRRCKAEVEVRACLKDIRKLEGFCRFLLGPTKSELHAAAGQGPILIVIVTTIRSDAIIITKDDFVLLPLPELEYEEVRKYQAVGPINFRNLEHLRRKNKEYVQFLQWLWDSCVRHIFQKLHELQVELVPEIKKFHVWWIGVGIASTLPFHAAGIYNRPGKDFDSALFQAISSYTPTLKILIHGRRKVMNDRAKPDVPSKPEILIVTMPSTACKPELDLNGVEDEAKGIEENVQGVYSPQRIFQPSAKDTMERMKKCEIVHFACHGQSSLIDPSSSHLLLQVTDPDSATPRIDEMRVRDVAALKLTSGKLAFLSACSTAENRLVTMWDEALHLASGFHVAGYLHTVGNLWSADDELSVDIVNEFYQHLVKAGELGDGQNVAKALNEALTIVMKKKRKQPLGWAQFVHFGV